jgi:hypothetical protein
MLLFLLFLITPALAQISFTDQTAAAGITLRNTFGGLEKKYIVESHGSGAAFFDGDNDGDLDLYVVNGATFETYQQRSGPGDVFYRNEGGGQFADLTVQAGLGDPGWGGGCAVGDIDNDGYRDLYVTNYGPNTLYHNQGKGHFADITGRAGVAGDDYSASAAVFDVDNDGWQDLYLGGSDYAGNRGLWFHNEGTDAAGIPQFTSMTTQDTFSGGLREIHLAAHSRSTTAQVFSAGCHVATGRHTCPLTPYPAVRPRAQAVSRAGSAGERSERTLYTVEHAATIGTGWVSSPPPSGSLVARR